MKILTRSTIVQTNIKLRRERMLPEPGDVVASPGQDVSPVQVVARTRRPTRFRIVPASELWHISPAEVEEFLVIGQGTPVGVGDVLLEKKQFLGKKRLESPAEGTFFGLNNGRIILQQYEWFEMRALVNARVVNAVPKRGIVLEIIGAQIQGVWGSGKEGYGRLRLVTSAINKALAPDEITDAENGVIVAGVIDNPDVLQRLQRLGANGLIAGSVTANVLQKAAAFDLPIIVTDGIGTQGLARNIFDCLRDYEGADVALFARQTDYWGNRPEIIISHEKTAGPTNTPDPLQPLTAGQRVRILRQPYQSQIGEIVYLYQKIKETDFGPRVRGADVRLMDGNVVFVPYANLDTIV